MIPVPIQAFIISVLSFCVNTIIYLNIMLFYSCIIIISLKIFIHMYSKLYCSEFIIKQ